VLALYAFGIELARVRETVREPQIGEIRLQWWLDALDRIYGGEAPPTPVAQSLARAVEHAGLPKHALRGMVEARRFDLYDDPMSDLAMLEGYLGETSSALIQLAALVLAGPQARGAAEAAGLAGVAFGIVGLLRSIPIHSARGQCFVPKDFLARRGLTPAHVLSGRTGKAMGIVLAELRHHAATRLAQARALTATVPLKALPAFLHVSLTDAYLAKLARRGFNPLKEIAEVSQVRKQVRLLARSMAEEF
jgi:phytoene synthase